MNESKSSIYLILFICSLEYALASSLASVQGFCAKYNCTCPEPMREIKCSFPQNVKSIDYLDPSTTVVDFSDNSLEFFTFGDVGLGINKLILRNNSIRIIHEDSFVKLPHLHYLDLSSNKIDSFQETAFSSNNVLSFLNLSKAFVDDDYKITRELCELLSLEVLDISYLNLDEFTLICWKTAHLKKLYLNYAKNVDKSWIYWFQYIGQKLELLDLSNSDVLILDPKAVALSPSLSSLHLANCFNIDKSSLFEFLKTNNLFQRLVSLDISNINASSINLDLNYLIMSSTNTSLTRLDISNNKYTDDLNKLIFNQQNLNKLVYLNARKNMFRQCNQTLIARTDSTLLPLLEHLDLSFNNLEGSSCLYSIKPLNKLKYLDMSHNRLKIASSEFSQNSFELMFADKLNLTYIDFSSNQFLFFKIYLTPQHSAINLFDFSNNNLKLFNFISTTRMKSSSKPSERKKLRNVMRTAAADYDEMEDLNYEDYKDEDEKDDNSDILIENHTKDDLDDDIRYIVIDHLYLSKNQFHFIFLQHMFQSIRNINYLDLSLNPIEHVIGLSGDALLVNNVIANKTLNVDNQMEALCIDELDLSNCKIKRLPNLQHTCINKLDLAYNQIAGSVHLIMSKYSVFFMDYLNLQANDISFIKLLVSEQKFKQDTYSIKNSPLHYFYGMNSIQTGTNVTHTYIDLKLNKNFKCDCNLIRILYEFSAIRLLSECLSDTLKEKCIKDDTFNQNGITIKKLNEKFRVLFIVTCLILIILSFLIVYYMCSDCMKNMQPYDRFRVNMNRVLNCCSLLKKKTANIYSNNGSLSTSNLTSSSLTNSVHYTKLTNEVSASQIEINS